MKNRIVEIEELNFLVDDATYDLYWRAKKFADLMEDYMIVCRRILGLSPAQHTLDKSYIRNHSWGSLSDEQIEVLANSKTVQYEEKWYVDQANRIEKSSAQESVNITTKLNETIYKRFPKRRRHKL